MKTNQDEQELDTYATKLNEERQSISDGYYRVRTDTSNKETK